MKTWNAAHCWFDPHTIDSLFFVFPSHIWCKINKLLKWVSTHQKLLRGKNRDEPWWNIFCDVTSSTLISFYYRDGAFSSLISFYYRDETFSTLISFYYRDRTFSTLISFYYRDGTFSTLISFYCFGVTFCTLISLNRDGTLSTLIIISLPWDLTFSAWRRIFMLFLYDRDCDLSLLSERA